MRGRSPLRSPALPARTTPARRRASALWIAAALALGCAPDVRLGRACAYNGDCDAPYVCGFGRCRAECRANVDCPLGATCRLDTDGIGTCSLDDDPPCDPAHPCAAGLDCVGARCVDACASDDECASGNECWAVPELGAQLCVDPRARPDGGVPAPRDAGGAPDAAIDRDAGAPDAGGGCHGPGCDPIVEVRVAFEHACARTLAGAIWCWGSDAAGEASGARPATASCRGGTWYCTPSPVAIPRSMNHPAEQLALGDGYACALLSGGFVQCWGAGRPGPAVDGSTAPALLEDATGPVTDVLAIAGGRCHLLLASPDGLHGVGCGDYGALAGAPSTAEVVRLGADTAIPGPLAAGNGFSCELRGGTAWCWGSNDRSQLGARGGATADPAPVAGLDGTSVAVAAGAEHACALRDDGTVRCWGSDYAAIAQATPFVVRGPAGTLAVALRDLASAPGAQSGVTCARTDTAPSELRCWGGAPIEGFFPDGVGAHDRMIPMWPAELGDVVAYALDSGTGCAADARGDLRCWGSNRGGTLGRGSAEEVALGPAPVRWP